MQLVSFRDRPVFAAVLNLCIYSLRLKHVSEAHTVPVNTDSLLQPNTTNNRIHRPTKLPQNPTGRVPISRQSRRTRRMLSGVLPQW